MANFETLLSPSGILLYGRVLTDLVFSFQPPPSTIPPDTGVGSDGAPPRLGDNNFLQNQLEAGDVRFARIYGFSYEGYYYDLARPTIFLVHGPGTDAEGPRGGAGRFSRAPAHADRTGVAAQEYEFAEDIKVWSYDKGDFSIRMDVETGPFDQILLDAEQGDEATEAFYSGQRARVSGQRARVSGQRARVSGQRVRTRDRSD